MKIEKLIEQLQTAKRNGVTDIFISADEMENIISGNIIGIDSLTLELFKNGKHIDNEQNEEENIYIEFIEDNIDAFMYAVENNETDSFYEEEWMFNYVKEKYKDYDEEDDEEEEE